MNKFLPVLLGVALLLSALFAPRPVLAASLQLNVSYGGNGAVMNIFVPDNVDAFPAILVSLHYCNGEATNAANWFTPSLAEQYGFIVIVPGLPSTDADGCWDVGSAESQTHDGGSHSKAIAQMVAYAVTTYGADPTRVYAVGASSGAMMTNVLMGSYPDVFAAGSVLAGVPFGCWTAGDGWTSACADGSTTKTASQWGDLVRNAYPGFAGTRPRIQLWHGTLDTTLDYKNLAEEVKQWTNVFGVSETATSMQQDTPQLGWTRSNFESGGKVVLEVNIGQGQGHDLVTGTGLFDDIIRFFALEQDVAPGAGGQGGSGGMQGGAGGMGGVSTGGSSGSGGTAGDGGSAGTGGAVVSAGSGAAGTGGTATLAQPNESRSDSGGCGIVTVGSRRERGVMSLLLSLGAIGFLRRGRRRLTLRATRPSRIVPKLDRARKRGEIEV